MTPPSTTQPQSNQRDPDVFVRMGGWLFRCRTFLPLPIVLAVLLFPSTSSSSSLRWTGVTLCAAGELLRLWAVHHIGVISRTRSDRLGPLVATGPFRLVRNPLYLGNIALWTGFALSARIAWLTLPIFVLLGFQYRAIVRWEERLLALRLGESYRAYVVSVPRWLPRPGGRIDRGRFSAEVSDRKVSWGETFFSERGTLLAIAAGYLVLGLKSKL